MKKYLMITIAMAMMFVFAGGVLAKNPKHPADYNGLNKPSKVHHLYLYEKTGEPDWNIVEDGAWGKLTYREDGFVFNGHGLASDTDYTLVEYNDVWPDVVVLDSGTTNATGGIHLSGDHSVETGMKYWLVLSSDVAGDDLTAWNPADYLFEYDLAK